MSKSPDTDISEVRERRWSCDDQDSRGGCRNPHGCHCAEITALHASKEEAESKVAGLVAEVERLKGEVRNREAGWDMALDQRDAAKSALAASKAEREALVEGLRKIAKDGSCPNGDVHLQAIARTLISKTGEG